MSAAERLADRLSLVVITDAETGGRDLLDVVRAALSGGAPAIQLRAKALPTRELVELGRALRRATADAGALLFVNDRVDVALVVGADGAHLGDDDLPLAAARRIAPPGFLVGRSADTPEQARAAEREGADYVGAGPVVATPSKLDAGAAIGAEGIAAVRAATSLPIVAIGGVGLDSAGEIARAGADGVAVIRAVMQAPDPERAARDLVEAVRSATRSGPSRT